MGTHVRVPASKEIFDRLPLFDGFPYLVTRIVGALRHVTLLPADWTEHELRRLAKNQASANRLETCLVFGRDRAVYLGIDADPSPVAEAPRGGLLVTGKLQAPSDFPLTDELVERARRLDGYIAALNPGGYLLGDSDATYRAATPEELAALAGRDSKGVLRGLERCANCGEYRGVCLGTAPAYTGSVTTVYCRCENHNLCARCREPLAEWRLNANHYDRKDGGVWHLPAFCGLKHQCSPRQAEEGMSEKIRVLAPGARARLEKWIAEGRGIAQWDDVDTMSLDGGAVFTAGDVPAPHSSLRFREYHDSLDDFEFVELIEVKRLKVTMWRAGEGLSAELSDDSVQRMNSEIAELELRTGRKVFYKFDYAAQEAVLGVPNLPATFH